MPLTERECVEILRQIRGMLQERGLFQLDDDASEALTDSEEKPPSMRLLLFLSELADIVGARSSATIDKTQRILAEYARTREGQQLRGVQIELSPEDREQYGIDGRVDLREFGEPERFSEEIEHLREFVAGEIDRERGRDRER